MQNKSSLLNYNNFQVLQDLSDALSLCELQSYTSIGSNTHGADESNGKNDNNNTKTNYVLDISGEALIEKAKNKVSEKHLNKLSALLEESLCNDWNKITSFFFPTGT